MPITRQNCRTILAARTGREFRFGPATSYNRMDERSPPGKARRPNLLEKLKMSLRTARIICAVFCTLAGWLCATAPFAANLATGQEVAKEPVKVPEIPAEPRAIDPSGLMPKKLAIAATIRFDDSSLRELVTWLETQELVVLLNSRALSADAISLGEPVSDHLTDGPIYLLLNRLRALGLDWYYEDDVLHITTITDVEERLSTKPYNVGDLLDLGYSTESLYDAVTRGVATDHWADVGGTGSIELLGDVLFVRQDPMHHREVLALLEALRKHGRRTLLLDPPQHLELREKLNNDVSVDFDDTPLETAIQELAAQSKADIRLDRSALRAIRIRDREPVSLRLAARNLRTVLQVVLSDLELTWVLRDGVLWVTSSEVEESLLKTAVFDVRDLCRDDNEASALQEAIVSQTSDNWEDNGYSGVLISPKPGVLVVRQTERSLDEVLNLLETYRTALRASKPRGQDAERGKEIVTKYYQLQDQIATDLELHLPQLVAQDSWQNAQNPMGVGSVLRIASNAEQTEKSTVKRAVLIIKQSRDTHEKIADILGRIENGDPRVEGGGGFGGGGQGGFGGGLFDVRPQANSKQ